MSPGILRQVCLQTPGILAQSWENIQDPSGPCWQVPVALKEEGWVVLLPCSTMGRRYPFLLRPSLWLVCPRAGEGVRKSQALKNRFGAAHGPVFLEHIGQSQMTAAHHVSQGLYRCCAGQ